jgi:hypothetical protein
MHWPSLPLVVPAALISILALVRSLFPPVVKCHFEIKDSGPEELADYETEAMASSAVVEGVDES